MSAYANIENYFDNFIKDHHNGITVEELKELKEMVLNRLER